MITPRILTGPSGAGKSFLGKFLESEGWLYLEADQHPKDGIDELGLRSEWDAFFGRRDPRALSDELIRRAEKHTGVILTLPSGAIPCPDLISASEAELNIRFLWGDPRNCLRAFLDREKKSGRNLPASHWDSNNGEVFKRLSQSAYHPYLVDVFDSQGVQIPCRELAQRI
jgi:hypothetical protein